MIRCSASRRCSHRRSRSDRQIVPYSGRLAADESGLLRSGVAALLVIIVVLWLDFRNVAGVLLGLLPLGAGLVITLAGLVC